MTFSAGKPVEHSSAGDATFEQFRAEAEHSSDNTPEALQFSPEAAVQQACSAHIPATADIRVDW